MLLQAGKQHPSLNYTTQVRLTGSLRPACQGSAFPVSALLYVNQTVMDRMSASLQNLYVENPNPQCDGTRGGR